MYKFLMLALLLSLSSSWAVDFSKYKAGLRSHMAKMLGEETTAKIMGASEEKSFVRLPNIPQVKMDATSTDVYKNKNREIDLQGESFAKLSEEDKKKYHVSFIQELYRVTRNSEPKEGDILTFLNVLEQGGSREGVYRAVTLDSVYSSLESYEEVPEKALVDFVLSFGERFLARRFNKAAIEKLNLWSIKRVIVEKSLELMDAMSNQPEDLRAWYAVLSSELAKNHSSIWNKKPRSEESPEFHLNWAKQVPFQHIKSEIIIKLNQTMNFLNSAQQ